MINVGSGRKARIEGSLRFNCMIPVHGECLHIFDFREFDDFAFFSSIAIPAVRLDSNEKIP